MKDLSFYILSAIIVFPCTYAFSTILLKIVDIEIFTATIVSIFITALCVRILKCL